MNRKNLVTLGIAGAMLLSAGAAAVTMFNQNTMRMFSSLGEGTTTEFAIHDGNTPSEAQDNYSTFTHEYTLSNGNKYTLKYTNVKRQSGAHIRLQAGNGVIEKVDESKGIQRIRLQINGVAWLCVSDNETYTGTFYRRYIGTTDSPTEYTVTGNYWKIVCDPSTSTNINYFDVRYSCVMGSEASRTSGDVNVSSLHYYQDGENKYFALMAQENSNYVFSFLGTANASYNDKVLAPSELEIVADGGVHRIAASRVEYRNSTQFEAYFVLNDFCSSYFSQHAQKLRFYAHLEVRKVAAEIYNDGGTMKNDLRSNTYAVKASEEYTVGKGKVQLINYTDYGGNYARLTFTPTVTLTGMGESGNTSHVYINESGDNAITDERFVISFVSTINYDYIAQDLDTFDVRDDSGHIVKPYEVGTYQNRIYLHFKTSAFYNFFKGDASKCHNFILHLYVNGAVFNGTGSGDFKATESISGTGVLRSRWLTENNVDTGWAYQVYEYWNIVVIRVYNRGTFPSGPGGM